MHRVAVELVCRAISVRGVVQGVGFRPFVYRLAHEHGLAGWVLNHSGGVEIEVEGPAAALVAFVRDLGMMAEGPISPSPADQGDKDIFEGRLDGFDGCTGDVLGR